MKKLHYLLVFLIWGTTCFSQDHEKLPAKPWKEIVEINSLKNNSLTNWKTNIYVSLVGKYTKEDSINIGNVLKKLDALTETISIQFSKSEKSNFKIKFLEDIENGDIGYVEGKFDTKDERQGYNSCELYFYKMAAISTDKEIKKSLEPRIAKTLVGGNFAYPSITERNSIFNLNYYHSNRNIPLNDEDKAIIKEVYKKGFEERLIKAESQFKESVLKKIEDAKISSRDISLWWVKNPVAVIFLPALILILLGLFFIHKIYQSMLKSRKIGFSLVL